MTFLTWDMLLMRRIDELHLEAPYYEARKLAKPLPILA
jgi:hypothetical protein